VHFDQNAYIEQIAVYLYDNKSTMAPSQRVKAAIIPLDPPKEEDIEYVKHRRSEVNNGVTKEIQERVPKLKDDASPYQILRFFTSFTQVRRHMHWTTGPRLFQRFHMHLEGVHLTTWEDQVQNLNETVVNFDAPFIEYKRSLLEGYCYLDQMDYLQSVKKTKDQSPKDYLRIVQASETLACQLPDAPNNAGFTNMERRRNFFQAMPLDWQSKFIEANMRIKDETLTDMRIYFECLQELYPFEERNNDNAFSLPKLTNLIKTITNETGIKTMEDNLGNNNNNSQQNESNNVEQERSTLSQSTSSNSL
jgi:hypothetical protein